MSIKPVNVGVIGCGAISNAYFSANNVFDILNISTCADLDMDKARAKAEEHGIKAVTVDELFADPEIEVVLNLTIPKVHAEVNLRAIAAGKHAYTEKPLAINRDEARQSLEAADKAGLLLGSAPDTFFGNGIQSCRRLIDEGRIGTPIAATAFMACHGHESWHPSPAFYYHVGGGPMFDMGPYYMTALVNLIGPVARVGGIAKTTFAQRTITSEPLSGQVIDVETPTHLSGVLNFANGAVGTYIMSFDVYKKNLPCIEIHGTEGSLSVPDPNGFGGEIKLSEKGGEWQEMPHTLGHDEYQRGAGLADMGYAIRTGRKHRANGELAYHVTDIMQASLEGGEDGRFIDLESTCERPAAIPDGLKIGMLDE